MDIKDFNPTELDYTTGEPDYKSLWGDYQKRAEKSKFWLQDLK